MGFDCINKAVYTRLWNTNCTVNDDSKKNELC